MMKDLKLIVAVLAFAAIVIAVMNWIFPTPNRHQENVTATANIDLPSEDDYPAIRDAMNGVTHPAPRRELVGNCAEWLRNQTAPPTLSRERTLVCRDGDREVSVVRYWDDHEGTFGERPVNP